MFDWIEWLFRWRNYIVRTIFTLLMVSGFCLIIYLGPLALMFTVGFSQLVINFLFVWFKIFWSFFFVSKDTLRSSKMFSRNNSNRLLSLSHSWPALVSNLVVVYVNHFQLFLLWRKFGRLFWSSSTQNCKFISMSLCFKLFKV